MNTLPVKSASQPSWVRTWAGLCHISLGFLRLRLVVCFRGLNTRTLYLDSRVLEGHPLGTLHRVYRVLDSAQQSADNCTSNQALPSFLGQTVRAGHTCSCSHISYVAVKEMKHLEHVQKALCQRACWLRINFQNSGICKGLENISNGVCRPTSSK